MEKQTPGAPRGQTVHCPWYSEPPMGRDTPCTGHKARQVIVNEHLTDLKDSLNSAPNGAALALGSVAHVHKIQACSASRGRIEQLEVESYGPLLATEGSELEELSAEEASGEELGVREEDTGKLLGGVRERPGCGTDGNAGCDWPPRLVNEKQDFTGDEIPKQGVPTCGCRHASADPQQGYCEFRSRSCSFSCPHGDAFSPDPPRPYDGREDEEEQYEGGGPEEGALRPDGEHSSRKKGSRRQRTRSATKERDEGRRESRALPAKHRAARKRSHVEGRRSLRPEVPRQLEELVFLCVSYFRKFINLVVNVTHQCGEYVESGGMLLYTTCRLKGWDVDSMKASLQSSAQSLGQRTRSLSLTLKQWGCSWGALTFRLLKMICALLFLVLMLCAGCLRLCWRHTRSALAAVAQKVRGASDGAASFTPPPGSPLPRRLWASFRECRTCKYVTAWLQKWTHRVWTSKRLRTEGGAVPAPGVSQCAAGRHPPNGEVERLLTMADLPEEELNPFQVLGVEMNASDMELKKAYRQLAVLVHPDKNTHPRAEEAFKVVRAAWDIVSNPEKRKEYEIKRMSESELAKSMTELLSKLQDDLKEAMNTMMCSKCQGKHKRFEMERDPLCARYCAECSKSHPAEEGDFWAESSMLGLKITYFAMMEGKVYDITEWAGCQRVGISADTHRVPYHISFGSKNSGPTGRPRTVPESSPTSAADLQDLFNRIFQGPPGPMPNGGFFTPPQQPPPGAASPAAPKPDSVPKTETKPKRRKKVKRPFQR